MRVDVGEGTAYVRWNDRGDSSDPGQITVNGMTIMCADKDMRDLYACLEFLFGRPS